MYPLTPRPHYLPLAPALTGIAAPASGPFPLQGVAPVNPPLAPTLVLCVTDLASTQAV